MFSRVHKESRVEKVIFSCTWLCVFPVPYFTFTFSNLQPQQPRSRHAWFVCLASFATLQMTQFSIAAMDWVSIDESQKSTLMVVYIKNTWFWYLFRRSSPLSIHGIPALEQGWMAFLLLTLSKSHILAFNVLPRVTSWAVMNTMRDVSRFTDLLTFGRWQDTALTLTLVWDQ